MATVNIKNIVKNNTAKFSFYRAEYMYYEVVVDGQAYRFPVSHGGFRNCDVACRTQSNNSDALHPKGIRRPYLR